MTNKTLTTTLIALLCLIMTASAQRMSRQDYIDKYKALAIEDMEKYGIPASITMAQGCLESDNGNSRLARQANNHFGIKCKKEWTGKTISHDDDAKGECFRSYDNAEHSFRDHSEFLDKSQRYQGLFKLDIRDYKGWAKGLKAAGYATSPTYAEQLIKIIEDNQLDRLDRGELLPWETQVAVAEKPKEVVVEEVVAVPVPDETLMIDVDNYIVSVRSNPDFTVYVNNGSEFIVARPGDTFESVAKSFKTSARRLRKFNDVSSKGQLRAGEVVYLKTKASRSENGKLIHVASEGQTLHYLSQRYGIKLKKLAAINRLDADSPIGTGQQIRLM